MTPTEVFKLFLRKGLEPNERLAFTREIRNKIHSNDAILCYNPYWNEESPKGFELENVFVERLIKHTWYLPNGLGRYGESSSCTSLTSFMKYLLAYVPSIIGNAKQKNKYLERIQVDIPSGRGYKRYWELRLIKKWHNFLNEYIRNPNIIFYYYSQNQNKYELKNGIVI